MAALIDIIQGKRVDGHRPWPRLIVTQDVWRHVANEIAAGRATLLGLWGDASASCTVHMAFIEQDSNNIAVVSSECPGETFPSVSTLHPPASRLERAIHSLYGLQPVGAPDTRPWLDLGFWDVKYPLGSRMSAPDARQTYTFLPVEGESLHQYLPLARCMPASSSRDISASPRQAKPWYASKSAWATCIRALICDGGRDDRACGEACRTHVGRQHCRVRHRIRSCRRGSVGFGNRPHARNICVR